MCISAQRIIAASAVWSLTKAAPYQRWKSAFSKRGPNGGSGVGLSSAQLRYSSSAL